MIRKNPKLKCMCMREAASSYECRAAGLGENQTKLRLHSFPVSGFLFFYFSWTFLSFGREWASDSMTSRFLISRFSLIKDIIFTICVKIQIEPPWWLFLFYYHTCTPPSLIWRSMVDTIYTPLEILIIAPWYSISFEIRTLNHDFYLST